MDRFSEQLLETDRRIARAEMAVVIRIVEIDKLRVAGKSTAIAERTWVRVCRKPQGAART